MSTYYHCECFTCQALSLTMFSWSEGWTADHEAWFADHAGHDLGIRTEHDEPYPIAALDPPASSLVGRWFRGEIDDDEWRILQEKSPK